ncbi:MAG: hypothetical protein WCI30_05765 [Clostridia bacterium]
MKIIKPSLLKIILVIAFLTIFSYVDKLLLTHAKNTFDFIPRMVFTYFNLLALNVYVLHVHIGNWFKNKGKLEINLTYFVIALLLIAITGQLIIYPPLFYPYISLDYDYGMLAFFMVFYCLIKSFERKE